MNEFEHYDDPVLAARTRSWMQSRAPIAAPERLVFSIMDDVERAPRRPRALGLDRPVLRGLARFAALTLAIAIGVAGGILLTRSLPNVGPSAPPSPSGLVPSLRSIGELDTNGRILVAGRSGAWLATASGELVLMDAATAGLGAPINVGFVPSDMAVSIGSGTRPAETVWLVSPDRNLLRLDPGVGEFAAATGAAGSRVALGSRTAWVSQPGTIQRVDVDLMTNLGSVDVPGHRATDSLLVVGNALWVADPAGIERIDVSTGAHATPVAVSAGFLVASRGLVWAAEGGSFVGINPDSGNVGRTATLPPGIFKIEAVVTARDAVWLATNGPGGPLLVSVDPASGQTTSLTPLPAPAISIAVVGNQVWTLDSGGHVDRYEPG